MMLDQRDFAEQKSIHLPCNVHVGFCREQHTMRGWRSNKSKYDLQNATQQTSEKRDTCAVSVTFS
jgi:hypothetical protein